MFTGNNIIEFSKQFSNPEACYKYLDNCKWAEGYTCCKCANNNYSIGHKPYNRPCTRCKYDESPTARTLFHKLKFAIEKAFFIVFLVATGKKGNSSYELSRRLSLRQKTCYNFKRKVIKGMQEDSAALLRGQVEVDAFQVGGPEAGKYGRSKGKKTEVVLAIKTSAYGITRAYGQVINGSGSKELGAFFERYIAPDAGIKTDGWRGYRPLKGIYPFLRQYASNKGKSLKLVHRYIMMFKCWLRGIHHRVKHLQVYLDEYNYRFNNLKEYKDIFADLLGRMVKGEPVTIPELMREN